MTAKPSLLVHIDVDSPLKLLDFYKIKGVAFDESVLERFYSIAFERALDFFESNRIDATFFVVGNELESSQKIRQIISHVFQQGFEIENHTYSHPFGLADLEDDQIIFEIKRSGEIIESITGQRPTGFRSPGYSINNRIIQHLDMLGYSYDSSGFWSIMNPILALSHKFLFKGGLKNKGFGYVTNKLPQNPYFPSNCDWQKKEKEGNLLELPLPRATIFSLPFYHNFNLWTPAAYASSISNGIDKPYLVYLFHIIEFVDINDGLPKELLVHPNLKKPIGKKLAVSESIIQNLKRRYQIKKTKEYVGELLRLANKTMAD